MALLFVLLLDFSFLLRLFFVVVVVARPVTVSSYLLLVSSGSFILLWFFLFLSMFPRTISISVNGFGITMLCYVLWLMGKSTRT